MAKTRTYGFLITAISIVALMSAVTTYLGQSAQKGVASNVQTNQAAPIEKDRNERMKNRLASLLEEVGVHVPSELPVSEGKTYRELRIHWESFGKGGSAGLLKGEQLTDRSTLSRVDSIARVGAVPRERSLELSPDHILIAAVDENCGLQWWRLIVDPRLVRAEVGPTGEMRSENHYLSNVDFSIEYPDDPQLKVLRLYHPEWNGKDFHLKLLGTLPL